MKKEYAQYLLSETNHGYNKVAQDFAGTRRHIWPEIAFLFQQHIKQGDRVLDLGCGNGRCYSIIKRQGAQYFGIDKAKKLIEIAKEKYAGANFQTGDALRLPFENNYFDKVCSIAVLHQIPSREFRLQFLREARRILRDNGLLLLTVWQPHKPFPSLFKYIILKILHKSDLDYRDILWPGWNGKVKRYYHCFSERELKKLVQKAGFKILESSTTENKKGNRKNIYVVAQG